MDRLPVVAVNLPSELICQRNGDLGADVLRPISSAGRLSHTAARAWDALWANARAFGYDLTHTYGGAYRTLEAQRQLFFSRWSPQPIHGREHTWYAGGQWWLKVGVARAAVPGTSNHGLGIAVDTALGDSPAHAEPISPALRWLVEHAPDFGWSWELQSEPWHIRYFAGDNIPPDVLEWEESVKPG